MDAQLGSIRREFDLFPDNPHPKRNVTLADALMSGLATFILKDPSLLAFDERRQADAGNLERIFGIRQAPCDIVMRELLDAVDPELLRPMFRTLFSQLHKAKMLDPLIFYQGHFLLNTDGPGSLGSAKGGMEPSLQRILRAAIVHPDILEVVPLCPQVISKHQGAHKNAELKAAQRFLAQLREDHPHLKLIVVDGGLSSTGPRIRDLQENDMRFILGAKPGNHLLLFHHVEKAIQQGRAPVFSRSDPLEPHITHTFRFLNDVPLSQTNRNLMVNFLGYEEHDARNNETCCLSWVTDFKITRDNAFMLMRGGRARWKLDNETFNTFENQSVTLCHNTTLGNERLREVLTMLKMLAFFIDQTQQLTSPLYRAALQKAGSKAALWELQRNLFHCFELDSIEMLYNTMVTGFRKRRPEAMSRGERQAIPMNYSRSASRSW